MIGQTLSHYKILELLGVGGMGEVYRALDATLGREVALKVLPAELAGDRERLGRFRREGESLAALNHPNIVTIYSIEHAGDAHFLTMELVEGRALSGLIPGGGMALERVFGIGIPMADALAAAHEKGIVHRDLKPGNIMVTGDQRVKILDFGLAKLRPELGPGGGTEISTMSLTAEGRVIGTVPYMSPEQLEGRALDHRSDIFSLGVVLYEMATGERPFQGETSVSLVTSILRDQPRDLDTVRRDLPHQLARIVDHCLEKDPEDRFQSVKDVRNELKQLSGEVEADRAVLAAGGPRLPARSFRRARGMHLLLGGSLIGALCVVALTLGPRWAAVRSDPHTLVALPLEMEGERPSGDYLGRAVAEAIAVQLAQAPALRILPVPAGPDAAADPSLSGVERARRMGAGQVVTGSILRRGERLEARVSLVDTVQNRLLWGGRETVDEDNFGRLVALVTDEILRRLDLALPDRYEYVGNLTGGAEMAASPDTAEAIGSFRRGEIGRFLDAAERVVEQFPHELDAHVLRALARLLAWDADPSPVHREQLQEALSILQRVDPENPYGPFFRGHLAVLEGKPTASLETYGELLERRDLAPSTRAWFLRWRAYALQASGDSAAALADLEESLRLDPTSAWTLTMLARAMLARQGVVEAVQYARQAVSLTPSYWRTHLTLGDALFAAGDMAKAILSYQESCSRSASQVACTSHAIALWRAGRTAEAAEVIAGAEQLAADPIGSYNLGCYWALAGDAGRALRQLEEAARMGFDLRSAPSDRDLVSLRDHPRFRALVDEAIQQPGPDAER